MTQMGLYGSKQLETTFHRFCEKLLHITFKNIKIERLKINRTKLLVLH